jgi:hypothetical protein
LVPRLPRMPPGKPEAMFVQYETTLPVPFATATARLENVVHGTVLVAASQQSYGEGVTGVLRVGPLGSARGVSRLVEVRFRDLVIRGDTAVLTLRWEASGPGGGLFPALDADLTLTAAGADATALRLDGSYRPPLGAIGERLDRAILFRVANATMESFVSRVGQAITDPALSTAPVRLNEGEPAWEWPQT